MIARKKDKSNDVMSARDLAKYLGIGTYAVYKGLKDGSIPSRKLGNKFLISRLAVDQWRQERG